MRNKIFDEWRALFGLACPIAITHFALMGLVLVDTAIVGHSSPVDLAGVSLARSITFALSSIGIGVAATLEPIASQALGSGEPHRAWGAFRNALRAAVILSPLTFLVSLALVFAMPFFGIERDVVRSAELFLYGSAPTIFLFLAFSIDKTFLQAHGRTFPALLGALLANVVNYGMCRLLVHGDAALRPLATLLHLPLALGIPPLGALGAGLAGSLSSLLLFLVLEIDSRRFRSAERADVPSPTRIIRMAWPVGLQMLAEIGVFAIAAFLSGRLGASVLAAHQIALALASFTFTGAMGIGSATAVRVGRAVGEGRSPRMEGLVGIASGGGFMLIGSAIFTFFPRELVSLFTNDVDVREIATSLCRVAAFFQFFDGIQVVAAGALRGAGDFRIPFLANVSAHWGIGFPLALILGFMQHRGALGIWYGLTSGLIVVAVLLALRFERLSRSKIEQLLPEAGSSRIEP